MRRRFSEQVFTSDRVIVAHGTSNEADCVKHGAFVLHAISELFPSTTRSLGLVSCISLSIQSAPSGTEGGVKGRLAPRGLNDEAGWLRLEDLDQLLVCITWREKIVQCIGCIIRYRKACSAVKVLR